MRDFLRENKTLIFIGALAVAGIVVLAVRSPVPASESRAAIRQLKENTIKIDSILTIVKELRDNQNVETHKEE